MIRDVKKFQNKVYDLLVIGGGINGAAIAYMAALAGVKVALVEKNDFASGTSSKSSKLLHGGIRYLENFEFDLVQEALKERYIQYKNSPHLVKPLSFVIPVYQKDPRPLWMMKLGVWLYDMLSGPNSLGIHQKLTRQQIIASAPHISQQGLIGGVSYWDAQMDDTRICLENILMADSKGADVANHVEVIDFIKENTKCIGVNAKDTLTGHLFQVRAKQIISTVGPWTDQLLHKDYSKNKPRLRLTKGIHIVYRGQISDKAFLLQSVSDRRVFFVIPFKGNTLIGTTDTDYEENLDRVEVTKADISYLLKESARVFPKIDFKEENIITTFAGLRPLVFEKGSVSTVSRKHRIEKTFSGLWYVAGGKYTTYRAIAKECVERLFPNLSQKLQADNDYPLYGSATVSLDIKQTASYFGVDRDTVSYLIGFYGARYWDVLKLIDDDHSLRARLCTCSKAIRAQVAYSCKVEMAKTFDDVYTHRLELHYNDCQTRQCRKSVEDVFKSHVS